MWFPLFMLASSVSKSLQCLISTLTQGGEGGLLFRLTCSVMLWRGRNTANKYHWRVWGVLAVSQPPWVYSHSWSVCYPILHYYRLQVALQGAVPGLCVLPRSKLLRFQFSGTPQRRTLSWVCVLQPSEVRAVQTTRYLVSTLSLGGVLCLITYPIPAAPFPG